MKIDESIVRGELIIFLLDIIKLPEISSSIVNDFVDKCKRKQEEKR